MNIRTFLFAGSLTLLSLSPAQATSIKADVKVIQTAKTEITAPIVKPDAVKSTETPVPAQKKATTQAESAKLDGTVTMSVGTIIIVLLLIIILL